MFKLDELTDERCPLLQPFGDALKHRVLDPKFIQPLLVLTGNTLAIERKNKVRLKQEKIGYLPSRTTCNNCIEENQVTIDKSMVLFHEALVLLGCGQVEKSALTNCGATKARGCQIFLLTLREGTVVKAEFLTIFDGLLREHADAVQVFILFHFRYCFTVGVAAVTQTRCIVSK